MQITIEEALCIIQCGWSTNEQRELYEIAYNTVRTISNRKHLQYQKMLIEKKLAEENDEKI